MTSSKSTVRLVMFAFVTLAALILAPTLLSAGEVQEPMPETDLKGPSLEHVTYDEAGLPKTVFEPGGFECERCTCEFEATPPTTRVGATCLRARQNAAAAARALVFCENDSCGPVTHSVQPCVPLSTGGFSATATAYYYCNRCENICL